jgi:outer membrane biosynthesis protein TonB
MMTSYRNRDLRRTAVGLTISLLLHAALFLFFRTQAPKPLEASGNSDKGPLVVELRPRQPLQKPAPPVEAVTPPAAAPARPPRPAARKPVEKKPAEKKASAPRPAAPSRSATLPRAPESTRPVPPPSPAPDNAAPPTDMSDMVAAARARRRAAGIPVPEDPPADDAARPQGDEVARANIARSIAQARGPRTSGGVFQITHKGVREAEFLFRGWENDSRAAARQLIRVDAGPNGDVEDAIVRRMIQIIRERQSGDFSWNSYRLGRVVVLSARPADNAGLMDFLKQEFFGSGR